ncbi:MAG: flagellar hook-associated protein FlgK [Candidatus Eisenbacteria bacterium]|nr:flagellar hook-associated protein FlgK [Candidatus Eisenbacteria bacterium]
MLSLNASLEIARRALQTQQLAMSVIGTNIANVNTPGYSRRRTVFQSGIEIETGVGTVGAGAEIVNIERIRDATIDTLFRKHNSNYGKWGGLRNHLSKVETVLNEPNVGSLGNAMEAFWGSWYDLSMEPENQAARAQVRELGKQLTSSFHELHGHLLDLQSNLTDEIEAHIDEINGISERLAQLNTMIMEGEFGGHGASGLRDERDLLLDQLSEIVNIQVDEQLDGSTTVMMGSQVLVQRYTGRQLVLATGTDRTAHSTEIMWRDSNQEASFSSGLLSGYITARDDKIQGYIDDLDELAAAFVGQVNTLHAAGFGLDGGTGRNFFNPERTGAAVIDLDTAILCGLDSIAASTGGLEGDGNQALLIANLKNGLVMESGSATISTFYNAMVGRIGFDSQEAASFADAEEFLLLDIDNQKLGVSGVSLDEEMTNLLAYQHAYEAMVQVTSTIDEMMASLIQNLG